MRYAVHPRGLGVGSVEGCRTRVSIPPERSTGKGEKQRGGAIKNLEHVHQETVRVAPKKKKKGMLAMKIGPITSLPAAAAAAAGDADADNAGSIGRREAAAASDTAPLPPVLTAAAAPAASSAARPKAVDHSAQVAGVARFETHGDADAEDAAPSGEDAAHTDSGGGGGGGSEVRKGRKRVAVTPRRPASCVSPLY
jgi:hypothetical protein